jgi:hypothetical protein
MKSNLVRVMLMLLFLALCAGPSVTPARADGGFPYPPICPGPCPGN